MEDHLFEDFSRSFAFRKLRGLLGKLISFYFKKRIIRGDQFKK